MNRQRASELQKFLFTSTKPDENEHRCVVVIDEKHAASYRHGGHSQLKMDEVVILYNVVEPKIQYESTVTAVSKNHDIIVFKLIKGTFENFPRKTGELFGGKEYLQLGVHSGREPMWNQGIISERKIGFYIGTSHRQAGDLGSGIFDSAGYFLGISTTKRENMPIASHHQETRIISSEVIFAFAGIVDEEEAAKYKPIEEFGEDHEDDKISRETFASRPVLNRQIHKKTALELEKLLFTSTKPDENVHRCVVVIDKKNAVSYRHGGHSQLKIYDKVMLYNVLEPSMIYESTVEAFSERHDIIVFKLIEGTFENIPRNVKTLCYRDKYFQVGLNSRREPIWNEGIVTEQEIGHYCTGASHGETGDLGSGIFDSSRTLLGISIAKKCLSCSQSMSDEEIAGHQNTRITSAETIFVVAKTNEGPDEDDQYKPIEAFGDDHEEDKYEPIGEFGENHEDDQYEPIEDE